MDERRTRWWNNGSCAAAATECGADAAYCASHPFVRVRRHGLFVALHNSYFAATVATKAHVAAFARTRGWNRTRHKAYGVREFSASGIQYYDDFAADRLAPVSGWWPPREGHPAHATCCAEPGMACFACSGVPSRPWSIQPCPTTSMMST